MHQKIALSLAVAALGATTLAGPASAGSQPLGEHVSECAREHLGKRPNPPALVCEHDGERHGFATFGAMVAHIRAEH